MEPPPVPFEEENRNLRRDVSHWTRLYANLTARFEKDAVLRVQEISAYEEKLMGMQEVVERLEQRCHVLESRLEDARRASAEHQEARERAESRLAATEQENKELAKKEDAHLEALIKLTLQYEKECDKVVQKDQAIIRIDRLLQDELDRNEVERRRAKDKYDELQAERDVIETARKSLEEDLSILRTMLASSEQENEDQRTRIDALDRALEETEGQLRASTSSFERANAELSELHRVCADDGEERQRLERKASERDDLQERTRELQRELLQLRTELKTSKDDLALTRDRLRTSETTIANMTKSDSSQNPSIRAPSNSDVVLPESPANALLWELTSSKSPAKGTAKAPNTTLDEQLVESTMISRMRLRDGTKPVPRVVVDTDDDDDTELQAPADISNETLIVESTSGTKRRQERTEEIGIEADRITLAVAYEAPWLSRNYTHCEQSAEGHPFLHSSVRRSASQAGNAPPKRRKVEIDNHPHDKISALRSAVPFLTERAQSVPAFPVNTVVRNKLPSPEHAYAGYVPRTILFKNYHAVISDALPTVCVESCTIVGINHLRNFTIGSMQPTQALFARYDRQPGLPVTPGAPGTLLVTHIPTPMPHGLPLLAAPPGRGDTRCIYLGDYICEFDTKRPDALSTEEWASLPSEVRNLWLETLTGAPADLRVNGFRDHACWSMLARIALRKRKLSAEHAANLAKELLSPDIAHLELTKDDIRNALNSGKEKLFVVKLVPTSFNTDWYRELQGLASGEITPKPRCGDDPARIEKHKNSRRSMPAPKRKRLSLNKMPMDVYSSE
ncbi:unnamed protein product [Peniophora sp. CBMAI 1063]|nr:unnamed protein product [Peniophora sp. CBMAI 1063]